MSPVKAKAKIGEYKKAEERKKYKHASGILS